MANVKSSRQSERPLPVALHGYIPARSRRLLITQVVATTGLIVFSLFYGAAFALFAPHLIAAFAVPLLLLALLVVWALPDAARAPTGALAVLYYAFIVTLVVWPNYLAVSLPGLPWLTLIRLTGFPMAAVFLLCLSMSPDVRDHLSRVVRDEQVPFFLLGIFVLTQIASIGFSHNKASSIQKFILYQIVWTGILFICVWFYSRPGRAKTWAGLLWTLGIFVGVIGLWQYKLHKLPWLGHIPPFLKIDNEAVQRSLAGTSRAYTGVLRIQSTFGTPLGLSEYVALTIPFVVHFALRGRQHWVRWSAALTIPFFIFIVVLTDSRLGMVGCFLTLVLYPLTIGVRRWRDHPQSLIGPSIVLAYPAAFCAAIASTFFVGKIRRYIWGGGAQQASTNARVEQFHLGLPKILHNPFGYGVGQGAETLGYAPFGVLTIDNYYMMVVLEYGVIGFIAYYGLIMWCIYSAGRASIFASSDDPDAPFLIPTAICLFNFFVIKSVYSEQDNHPLVFAMLGMVIAVYSRIRSSAKISLPELVKPQRSAGAMSGIPSPSRTAPV